jgi:hypothetical protein
VNTLHKGDDDDDDDDDDDNNNNNNTGQHLSINIIEVVNIHIRVYETVNKGQGISA